MTALLLASPAWAEKVVYTDSATKLIFLLDTETRTARIQGYSATPKGALTLPTEVTYQETTYAVDGVLESAFQGLARVTSLTAGENIKYIGPSAFKSCGMLRSATLKGVEVIPLFWSFCSSFWGQHPTANRESGRSCHSRNRWILW